MRNYRAKKKLSLTEKDKNLIRDKERIRKQKYRQHLKKQKLPQQICQSQATEPTVNTYKTSQSLGKAISGLQESFHIHQEKKQLL